MSSVAVRDDHDRLAELTALYVLGSLTEPERGAFEAHLAVCEPCADEVRSLTPAVDALVHLAPAARPSPAVRARVMAHVRGQTPRRSSGALAGWLAAAASIALAVLVGGYAAQLRQRVASLESALREAALRADTNERLMAVSRRDENDLRATVAVLVAPDLARIDLAGQPAAPSASARAFWSRSHGLVFTASNLPSPPPGRIYQLWVLTSAPRPTSAGLLRPDRTGAVTATFQTPADLPQPVAMAVTLEPDGGVPLPTGAKYLVGAANRGATS